jgi:ribonuclease VapC
VENNYVLDASALLSLLNSEEGSDLVQSCLPHSVISTVNLAEVVTCLSLVGIPEGEVHQALTILGLEIIPFDEEQAYCSGYLSIHTQPFGLSLGDRACLALALTNQSTAVTADRSWKKLELGVEIKLIR